jgi:hypothetical protein
VYVCVMPASECVLEWVQEEALKLMFPLLPPQETK